MISQLSKEEVWQLRHSVMYPDKELAAVQLDEDDQGVHYGLYIKGKLVSVVSLFMKNNEAQFRKFATLEEEQGNGYGTFLLSTVFAEAKQKGVKRIWCNARQNKVLFYKRFGLEEADEAFNRGGIAYVVMEKTLGEFVDERGCPV